MPWEDVEAVFSTPGEPQQCWCQWFRTGAAGWGGSTPQERAGDLRRQSGAGRPSAPTSGLLAYVDRRPVGWVAVAPRVEHPRLVEELAEDAGAGADVWSVTCFVVRPGHQGLGVTRALLDGALSWAREYGAVAVEGYTRVLQRGAAGEPDVVDLFAEAGFVEVGSQGRRVLRREL